MALSGLACPLTVGIVGPVIWAGSGFLPPPASAAVGAVGAAVGIVGAIWAQQSATTFERSFEVADWTRRADEFVLIVGEAEHRRGARPIVQLNAVRNGGGYEEVSADSRTLPDGTVELAAHQPFPGRMLIK
jgi:hypothetical protein